MRACPKLLSLLFKAPEQCLPTFYIVHGVRSIVGLPSEGRQSFTVQWLGCRSWISASRLLEILPEQLVYEKVWRLHPMEPLRALSWDLLILRALTVPPLEPLNLVSVRILSIRTAPVLPLNLLSA